MHRSNSHCVFRHGYGKSFANTALKKRFNIGFQYSFSNTSISLVETIIDQILFTSRSNSKLPKRLLPKTTGLIRVL
jgi:hypothetical protein